MYAKYILRCHFPSNWRSRCYYRSFETPSQVWLRNVDFEIGKHPWHRFSIMLHRWSYFYVSQVRMGNSPGCSDAESGPEVSQQPDQFLAVLQVFGQALLQLDINMFKTSLCSLENLNDKWRLYHKVCWSNSYVYFKVWSSNFCFNRRYLKSNFWRSSWRSW